MKVVEEKKPVQVNLAELMKQTGIVDDDDSFFMMDDEPPPPPPPPAPAPQIPTVIQPALSVVPAVPQITVETKENNVRIKNKLIFKTNNLKSK